MKRFKESGDNRKRISAGFTLIEIMIVVTILGLLATIVTVNAPSMIHRYRVKIARRNIQSIQNAVDIYYSEVGQYPKTLSDLVSSKDQDGIELKIIKKVPKDPWGNKFVYVVPGKYNEDYNISCLGGDGQVGGENRNSDINSWELDKATEP